MRRAQRFIVLAVLLTACRGKSPARDPVSVAVPASAVETRSGFVYPSSQLVLVTGAPVHVAPVEPPSAAVSVDPPLPTGLSLDGATGVIAGAVTTPSPGRLHTVRTADGRQVTALHLEVVPTPGAATDRFVATDGDDAAPGTLARPFRTVGRALSGASAGTTIYLRAGRHAENIRLHGVQGAADAPIVIRSYPGERAVIDGSTVPLTWKRATGAGAAPDEWVATTPRPEGKRDAYNRGEFVDRVPYTRLLTYSRLEDLRSSNHEWPRDGSKAGPALLGRDPTGNGTRAWTYFGPGLWFDAEAAVVHLRLSPTRHGAAGFDEYRGPTDPRQAAVTVSRRGDRALYVHGSSFIEIRDLVIAGGGDETARIERSSEILLDHVEVRAATTGLHLTETSRVRVLHSRIDGGLPPWVFRSDFKDNYRFEEDGGASVENNLVRKTQKMLLFVGPRSHDLEVAYTDLVNGHDIYMAGIDSELHHCRIHNIQDEALFISHTPDIANLRIHHNVISGVLVGVSGAGARPSGPRFIYRNIFDLREPTGGYRPEGNGKDPRRWGTLFKGDIGAAPFYFYQNTVLTRPSGQAAFLHFRSLEKSGEAAQPRWFLNNVLVAEIHDEDNDRALSIVPDSSYLQQVGTDGRPLLRSDGNLWVRPGDSQAPLFRCMTLVQGRRCQTKAFRELSALRSASSFDASSKTAADAGFARAPGRDRMRAGDDLRPGRSGAAVGTGIALDDFLPDMERPATGRPDAGALPRGAAPLQVGADGQHVY